MIYQMPTSNYLKRSLRINHSRPLKAVTMPVHMNPRRNIQKELRALNVSPVGIWRFAARYLPYILHADEQIGGIVYGRNDQDGSVMLIATDRRVIYINKKPLFLDEDEITYDVVSGINFTKAGLGCSVVLHTRIKNFVVHTVNRKAATRFVEYIEWHRVEKERDYDYVT